MPIKTPPTVYIKNNREKMEADAAAAVEKMEAVARRHGLELVRVTLAVPNGIVAIWGERV
jgi:hypothetical protein